jgi:PAS domain S-box-containing protein
MKIVQQVASRPRFVTGMQLAAVLALVAVSEVALRQADGSASPSAALIWLLRLFALLLIGSHLLTLLNRNPASSEKPSQATPAAAPGPSTAPQVESLHIPSASGGYELDLTDILQNQIQAIFDSMDVGIIYSEGHQTQFVNEALSELTGVNRKDWRGFLNPLRPASMTQVEFNDLNRTIREAALRDGMWRDELRLQRHDGNPLDVSVTCVRVSTGEGHPLSTVTMVRDIGIERALQERKLQFVANASHELRTPITNLKTRLYLLRKQPARFDEHLAVVEEVVDRLERLVERMLDISRIERGVISIRRERHDLRTLVERVARVQRGEAERKGLTLGLEVPRDPIEALVDWERLVQVLTNLVINAINYTPAGGRITIRLYGQQSHDESLPMACVEVEDTGQGIPADALPNIFEPFFRASPDSIGSGLGLSIVKEIVDLHGGTVSVDSQIGRGTVFAIRLMSVPSSQHA